MRGTDTEQKGIPGSLDASNATTRLTCSWLIVARIAWITCVVLILVILFASIPVYIAQLETICSGTGCAYRQLSLEQATALKAGGFSLSSYAAYNVVLDITSAIVFLSVSVVIFWRKWDDWMALLFTLSLVLCGTVFITETVAASHSVWSIPSLFLNELTFVSLYLIASLFPNGRFVPRWTHWLILGYVGIEFWRIFILLSDTSPDLNRYPLPILLFWLVVTLSLGIAQVHRYRRVSNPIQRQQTKWIVFSLLLSIVVGFGLEFPTLILPSLKILYGVFATTLTTIVVLLIPLSVGFAILRYRLWDIDVIINRTLVYGTLTVLLALVYFGLIFGLQYVLRGIISQNNDIAIVVSTLAIAALFQPLRHRIQAIIDRRFYRRKYDAAQIMEAFSATLRNELDLTQLREHLISVVQDTMQPAHATLWLRPPTNHRVTWSSTSTIPAEDETRSEN